MLQAGFEPAIPANERPQTYALAEDRQVWSVHVMTKERFIISYVLLQNCYILFYYIYYIQ